MPLFSGCAASTMGAAVMIWAGITTASVAAEFKGAGGHTASGHVEVVADGGNSRIVFQDDFRLQDAPAPRLAWGKGGYVAGTIFATLGKFDGAQEYAVPAGTDVTQYDELWIWCEKFDVPLAVATLR